MVNRFSSYQEFTAHLADREFFGQKLGLERIQGLLDRLGNPEKRFRSIHIAGTNGKGSTAAMIASILKEAGFRVGLYTSPHLQDFCERVQIFSDKISPEQVLHYARIIHEVEAPNDPLTFFELATAIAFLHFAEAKVDVAVIEVGMGGRLDATNVITPLVSVITTIGLDHTQYLGGTIEKIAFEKGGIIKKGVPVVTGQLAHEAMKVIEKVAVVHGSEVITSFAPIANRDRDRAPALPGSHQLQNASVAVVVIEELGRQGWSIPDTAISEGLRNVRWPGRLETVQERPWILLDGAHNPQAMAAVRRFLETTLEGRRLKVLFAAMGDKNSEGMLAEITPIGASPLVSEFFFTSLPLKRAADPYDLFKWVKSLARVITPAKKAFQFVKESLKEDEVFLVTGSFYLIGEVKKCLEG